MYTTAVLAALSLLTRAQATVLPRQAAADPGSGPYPSGYTTDTTLPNQTIFMPKTVPANLTLPVILYGVGGCSDAGASIANFHNEVASYGFMIIVNNGPTTRATVAADTLTKAADWVYANAGKGKYTAVDKTRMAVSGWSCGGLQAYTLANDTRISTIGILSSGQFAAADSLAVASKVTKPIFYFLGGSSDIAYANGERDYTDLPKTTPAWLGNDNKGHGHEYTAKGGGMIGKATTKWAQWMLRGDASAATFFKSTAEATTAGWQGILGQSLDKISVTPI